ncbi:GTA-gp10 family protein [Roseivivax sp. CAU 1761]
MRLTLGALAELEQALGAGSLVALAERFERGGFSSRDVIAVLAAGLRGGGGAALPDPAAAEIAGGPMAAARAAAELLARAFALPEG